jgi:hypothetical protein
MSLLLVLQECISSFGSKKRIELLRHHVNYKLNDVILDIGDNTGKILAAYS